MTSERWEEYRAQLETMASGLLWRFVLGIRQRMAIKAALVRIKELEGTLAAIKAGWSGRG